LLGVGKAVGCTRARFLFVILRYYPINGLLHQTEHCCQVFNCSIFYCILRSVVGKRTEFGGAFCVRVIACVCVCVCV
jgi:hypothetical protein